MLKRARIFLSISSYLDFIEYHVQHWCDRSNVRRVQRAVENVETLVKRCGVGHLLSYRLKRGVYLFVSFYFKFY